FQAEDGIRDFHVTGVQTCALPISPLPGPHWHAAAAPPPAMHGESRVRRDAPEAGAEEPAPLPSHLGESPSSVSPAPLSAAPVQEIGRASCRERVEISVVARRLTQE